MTLEELLYNIHFDIEKASPPNWEIDWEDAPLSYKLYRGLATVPLSAEVPLVLTGKEAARVQPDLRRIGHFFWYVFGLSQFSQSVFALDSTSQQEELMYSFRRFVPSGGGLYPSELYVYLKLEDLPAGVYHYDVAHHRLVLLREGNFDSYIGQALGERCDVSTSFCTVFVSVMFWKNYFKYNNFAYRLQGLDTGVLMGQLLEVAKRFGFETGVYLQFLDRAVNHLLGLSEQEESVYAVIPLSLGTAGWFPDKSGRDEIVAGDLCLELPEIRHVHYVRSRRMKEYPLLIKMNKASMLESTGQFQQFEPNEMEMKWVKDESIVKGRDEGHGIALPHVQRLSYDLAEACRKRYSPHLDFILGNVELQQLATLLLETTAAFSYRNDLDLAQRKQGARVELYGCVYQVEGIPNGAYYYDSYKHELQEVRLGDHRLQLQSGMSLDNVNLFQVPLCFHVAGEKEHYKSTLGYRGYRIEQMEAGMLVQRLLLSASALGWGGHPLLGYDASLCDGLYRTDLQGKTTLIQIPIGPYRPRPWLNAGLHN